MSTLVLDVEPMAVKVNIASDKLIVDLADGRSIIVPLEWYPCLLHGSPEEQGN